MQLAKCPNIRLEYMGKPLHCSYYFGSMVSLVCQSYFDQYIKAVLGPADRPEATAHNFFFNLKGAKEGKIPLTRYFDIGIGLLGLKLPKVGFLVVKDFNVVIK